MGAHVKDLVAKASGAALALVYPPQCVSCGERVEADHGLCAPCWRDTPFISGARCRCCGVPLMGGAADELAVCDDCLAQPRPWRQGRAALLYEGGGRRLVLGLKHGGREDIAIPAGAWMAQAGRDLICEDTLIVPVPLHWRRLVKRRFNQAALLARALGSETGAEVAVDALKRVARTQSLDRLSPAARFQVLEAAIAPRLDLTGRAVLLVDDVMTSGATFAAATEAALRAGARRVDVLALARAVRGP